MPPLSSLSPVSRRLARWRRPLLGGLGALLVLELLYNALLVTGLLATVLNLFLGRLSVDWSRAWSLIPGHVHVRDLTLRQEELNGGHWQLEMEQVEVELSLLSLLTRRLKTESLDVRGLRVLLHTVTPERGAKTSTKASRPDDPWELALYGVRVHEVRELLWNEARLTGITEVTGSLEMTPGRRVLVRDARVRLGPGQLFYQRAAVAHVEQGAGEVTLEVQRQEPEGLDLITGLTQGRLRFTASLPSLEGLRRLSPRFAGVVLRGGAGRIEADVHVKEGRLAPGTRIEGEGAPFVLPMVNPLALKAPWRLRADVYEREDGADRFGLKLTLGPVRLEGGAGPALETSEMTVLLGAKSPRLGQPLPDVHLVLRAARSNPLELRLLNGWLGPSFQVESGRLTLEASSHANPEMEGGEAHLELSTEDLQARWGGATLGGRVLVDVDMRKLAFHQDRVTLHGSRVLLRDVSVRTGGRDEAHGWDGTLDFPEATLSLSPLSFKGRFTGSFSNATPFIALLTEQGSLPRVLSSLLTARNLELSGSVSLGAEGAKVEGLHARGRGLELRGRAESVGGSPHAVMLVKVGPIPLGVEASAAGTHVQVLRPFHWYEQKTGERVK
ncbi:hypothetical protein JQX13_10650 [Archangium violaceum]|uniref:hypothetical protein n=1 Tax=Archangium violaceum TaxID=83451 RepID=UPI00193C3E99|nr:hypothetical protein [Archangium violaceum]QRK10503.1 hypothetical protein JQX13_10650 [Archangium violaceum]